MRQGITGNHEVDGEGNPAGGHTFGLGIRIEWQKGPLGRGEGREAPNGAFVEGVIQVAIDRLQFYQRSRFVCPENEEAIERLRAALIVLDKRTADREERDVEGTHEV